MMNPWMKGCDPETGGVMVYWRNGGRSNKVGIKVLGSMLTSWNHGVGDSVVFRAER